MKVNFEKIEEFGALMDKRSALWDELDQLMYRCLDDPGLLDVFSRKSEEYKAASEAIRDFRVK